MKLNIETSYRSRRILVHKLCGILVIAFLLNMFIAAAYSAFCDPKYTVMYEQPPRDAPFGLDEDILKSLSSKEIEILSKTEQTLFSRGYDKNSSRYKAIQTGLLMLNWKYSKNARWFYEKDPAGSVKGYRDCSSFVHTCYMPYTSFFDMEKEMATTTAALLSLARGTGVGYRYSSLVKHLQTRYGEEEWIDHLDSDPDRFLIPGDLVLCTGNWERQEGIGHVMIYLCDGYVLHATNTENKVVISYYGCWGVYGDDAMKRSGPRYVLPIPPTYDRGIPFDPNFLDYEYTKRIVKCTVNLKNILDAIKSAG